MFLLTRGTMVERDADILGEMAAQGLIEVCISVITQNADLSAKIEPGPPRRRNAWRRQSDGWASEYPSPSMSLR